MNDLLCCVCRKTIDTRRDFQKVSGWERRRDAGGTNGLRHRETLGRWAHGPCLDSERFVQTERLL